MKDNIEVKSESEIQYNSLVSYFKHLVWLTIGALSIIGLIAGILIFQDRASMRDDMTYVKDFAEQAIKNTTDSANNQITEIRTTAEKIAIDEARIRVSDAFKKNSIKEMIDITTKEMITQSVQNQFAIEVDKSLVKIKNDLANFGKISDAASKMRIGLLSGLIELQKMKENLKDEYLLEIANNYYDQISQDYDMVHTRGIRRNYPDSLKLIESKDIIFNFTKIKTDIPNLIKIINEETSLDFISIAFTMLRIKTNEQFETFNFDQVNKWWEENKINYLDVTKNEKN